MRRSLTVTAMVLGLSGCPGDAEAPPGIPSAPATDGGSSSSPIGSAPPPDSEGTPASTGASIAPWFEVGWGVSEFNEFDDTLPIVVGPQGLSMFSLPLRGAGFYNPPEPSFDDPDMPMLQAWVDVEGYALTAEGHFNEVVDYPALFYPSQEFPGILEGPAVWMVIPDQADPAELSGLRAHLHAELVDADDIRLTEDHELVIGEAPDSSSGR